MKKALSVALVAGMAASATAQASDEWEFGLGLGVGTGQSPYEGVGTETDLLPILMVEKGNFYLHGPELGYHLMSSDVAEFTLLGSYRGEGYEASDSRDLRGMDERKGAFELGGRGTLFTQYGDLSLTMLADVSGEHEGYEVELGWSTDLEFSRQFMLTPSVSYAYRSDDLNNYYFGVTSSEATAQRAAYTSDAGGIFNVGVDGMYMIDEQQSVMMSLGMDFYSSEISDSTIVERDNSLSGAIAYIYRF